MKDLAITPAHLNLTHMNIHRYGGFIIHCIFQHFHMYLKSIVNKLIFGYSLTKKDHGFLLFLNIQ